VDLGEFFSGAKSFRSSKTIGINQPPLSNTSCTKFVERRKVNPVSMVGVFCQGGQTIMQNLYGEGGRLVYAKEGSRNFKISVFSYYA